MALSQRDRAFLSFAITFLGGPDTNAHRSVNLELVVWVISFAAHLDVDANHNLRQQQAAAAKGYLPDQFLLRPSAMTGRDWKDIYRLSGGYERGDSMTPGS